MKPNNHIDVVRVIADYNATDLEQGVLSLKKGDIVYVLEKDESGWWKGYSASNPDNLGWLPKTYIEPVRSSDRSSSSDRSNGKHAARPTNDSIEDLARIPADPLEADANQEALRISPLKESFQQQLPPNWRSKKAPNGLVYYYNTQTNQTTYNLDQVLASAKQFPSRRSSIQLLRDTNTAVSTLSQGKPIAMALPRAAWIPGPKSLLEGGRVVSWEVLINNILKAISDLNYSAKNGIKQNFLPQASQIVRAIRDMLACSGTISAVSATIRSNRQLSTYHSNIMSSLSKIILAAKVATGTWPPPDAIHSMRYQAGQVLLAVRHFVAVAQDMGINLVSVVASGPDDEFDLKGTELSDSELISRLDHNCEVIVNGIAGLVTKITRDRTLSTPLLESVRKIINDIGQFMSLVEDMRFDPSLDTEGLVPDFMAKKEALYSVVNELVSASTTGNDGFAASNALGMMLETATCVLENVEIVLVATKLLVDHKELMVQQSLYAATGESGGELESLQKRAQNLSFVEGSGGGRRSSGGSGGSRSSLNQNNVPPSPRPRSRTASGELRVANGELRVDPTYRKGSIQPQQIRRGSQGSYQGPASGDTLSSSTKLAHFFGEGALPPNSARLSQDGRPWFLKKDPNYEISYNMEGAVNGGTFSSLVERMTIHDQPTDTGFMNSFLLTFHLFGSAEQLFNILLSRFTMQPPPGLSADDFATWTEKKLYPIQSRVALVIKTWLETFWIDNLDDVCLDDIHHFSNGAMMGPQPEEAQRILELVSLKVSAEVNIPSSTPRMSRRAASDLQIPILPKSLKKFGLLDLDPLEVARQLTIVEMGIFQKIMPVELMKQEWSRKNTNSVALNVRAMTAMSTKITGWIISTILQESDLKRRAYILKFFIKRCLTLNNFNGLIAVQSAFNSSTISRLKKTWELLSNKTRNSFEVLKKATDHSRNYSDYRNALKKVTMPCLPFLGLFLTDLTFTDDGNPDMRNNGKLINFDKYAKTAKIIQDIQRYQQKPYNFTEVAEIRDFLLQQIEENGSKDVQEMYELSLRLEPRDERASAGSTGPEDVNRELEAKIEMLQKAGML